jgi:hypothetical protein
MSSEIRCGQQDEGESAFVELMWNEMDRGKRLAGACIDSEILLI